MKLKILILLMIASMTNSNSALAGGSSTDYSIIEFQRHSATRATLTLSAVDEVSYLAAECRVKTILIQHKPELFFRRTWSGRLVSRTTHIQSLDLLEQIAIAQLTVRFGAVGRGLQPTDTYCQFASRGLFSIQDEPEGEVAIYSLHEPI